MKKKSMKKILSFLLCVVLTAALALTGCENKASNEIQSGSKINEIKEEVPVSEGTDSEEVNVLGQGETMFKLDVIDKDEKESHFEIHTDKKTVGEALVDVKLVEGTEGEYGLMIETVNGQTLDFNKDGMYWAFLIDGEYAQTGVDSTDIVSGTTYSLVASK